MHKKQEKLCGFTGNVDIVQICVCEHPMLMHAFPGKCMYEGCWCRNWQLKKETKAMTPKHTPTPWSFRVIPGQLGAQLKGDDKSIIGKTLHERDAAFIVKAVNEREEFVDAMKAANASVKELFKELGKKQVGDWAVINDGLVKLEKALAKAESL